MKPKKRITIQMVRKWLILACTGFFVVGGISGYFIAKASAAVKPETNMPTQTTEQPLQVEKEEQPTVKSIGEFTLSAYCSCEKCCGKSDGITATGAKVKQGVTVAVDPNVIPYGTTIIINGKEFKAQDTMAKRIIEKYDGRIIDIYFSSHAEAKEFGLQTAEIYVKG